MNEPLHTYGSHMDQSRHTYERVMSHIWMSHVTRMNESVTCACVCIENADRHTHRYVRHDSFICLTYSSICTPLYDMTPACLKVIWVIWISLHWECILNIAHVAFELYTSDMAHSFVWHDSSNCAILTHPWLIHVCHITHSRVTHGSFMFKLLNATRRIQLGMAIPYEWVRSHILMCHVAHVSESCRTYWWVMAHIWMSHGTPMKETCMAISYEWVMSHILMSHVTHMNGSCRTCGWVMSLMCSRHSHT